MPDAAGSPYDEWTPWRDRPSLGEDEDFIAWSHQPDPRSVRIEEEESRFWRFGDWAGS